MKILFKILVSIISCYILLQVQCRLDNYHPPTLTTTTHQPSQPPPTNPHNHQPSQSAICAAQVVLKCFSRPPGRHSVCDTHWVRSLGWLLHSHTQLLFWLKLAWQQALWGLLPLLWNFLALTPGFFLLRCGLPVSGQHGCHSGVWSHLPPLQFTI